MATTASRRKGSTDASGSSAGGAYLNSSTMNATGGKRQNTARNHANLQMSSATTSKRGSTGEESLRPLTSHVRNKSSDKLHRAGASSSSSTAFGHGKRSKSYSQIMSATAETLAANPTTANDKKQKFRRGKSDDYTTQMRQSNSIEEDGWISADQTGSTSDGGEDESSPVETIGKPGKPRKPSNADEKTPRVSSKSLPEEDEITTPKDLPRQSSEETLAVKQDQESRTALQRHESEASTRTLMGVSPLERSRSQSPTTSRQKRRSLLSNAAPPRAEATAAVPPKLSTEYAFAGEWGKEARHRASEPNVGASIGSPTEKSNRSYDVSTVGHPPQIRLSSGSTMKRKSSVSSTRSSFINLPSASPSLGQISHEAVNAETDGIQRPKALEAMQRASTLSRGSQSAFVIPTERPLSSSSLEASRVANRLRMTSTMQSDASEEPSSASKMLANSGTKYFMGVKGDGPTAKALAKYNRPTVSVFVNRQEDFKSVEKVVPSGSLFDEDFTRASLKGDQQERDTSTRGTYVRHVMAYGLSGPAIQKTPTTQALLATCLDNDEFEASWAPALTHAAGLGGEGMHSITTADGEIDDGRMNVVGGLFINGPNATPLHFLHGLTNTNDGAFPLDEADLGADSGVIAAGQGEYVDAKNLRAIALTWSALNATKNHIITRRYVDPMRESMERIALAGGFQQNASHSGAGLSSNNNNVESQSGYANPAGSSSNASTGSLRWGWRSLLQHQQQQQQQQQQEGHI